VTYTPPTTVPELRDRVQRLHDQAFVAANHYRAEEREHPRHFHDGETVAYRHVLEFLRQSGPEVVADSPDTGVLANDLMAQVHQLLEVEVHADEIRDLVERAIREWRAG